MKPEDVTLIEKAIHNPKDPRHFMRILKPGKKISALYNDEIIAQSTDTLVVIEAGYDMYDPAYYFPQQDVKMNMFDATDKSTHCPLKGDTTYYDFNHSNGSEKEFAWNYSKPFERSEELKDHLAFDLSKVSIVIEPA